MSNTLPKFSELPLRPGDPPYTAWGLYGDKDERGTLNRLNSTLVLQAKEEIQTGETMSMNLPLDALAESNVVGRKGFEFNQYCKHPRIVVDDTWSFNSQCSTQWDGLRHWSYQKTGQFYNGNTLDDFFNEDKSMKSNVIGIQNYEKNGIVGRGVLLDFDRWRRAQRIDFDPLPFNPSKITVDQLKAVAESQGTEIKFGDILFIRTGFTPAYLDLKSEDKRKISTMWQSSGLAQGEETLEWIWSNFSAVASDSITLEFWPSVKEYYLHDVLIAGWGMPFGELFDMERAAEYCAKKNRWSFFVTSEVCNVPGACASPANLLAIF